MTSRESIASPGFKWWGVRTEGGLLVVGRYVDHFDLDELRDRTDVEEVVGPFEAHTKMDALIRAGDLLDLDTEVAYAEGEADSV